MERRVMDTKYTKDGKKVAVLGKLNNEEWIVQEIFVTNGKEFPGGENFTTKTLLDEPAKSWAEKHKDETERTLKAARAVLEKLQTDTKIIRQKKNAADLINKIIASYSEIDVAQLETLCLFVSGQITHCVIKTWNGYQIRQLADLLSSNNDYGRLEGIKLVSLFGCRENGERQNGDRYYSLAWRINQYRDGSGSESTIWPCVSHDAAIAKIDELIADSPACQELIDLKKKYNLQNPTAEKISDYRKKYLDAQEKNVEDKRGVLRAEEIKLLELHNQSEKENSND